jgi:hypothetical protein
MHKRTLRLGRLALAILAIGCVTAVAQDAPEPSPEHEPFSIQPGTIESGAANVELRLVSTTPAGFAVSSARPPRLTFGAGVTLVEGSFEVLNQTEARCVVNADSEAFGTVEASIRFYSLSGNSVLKTMRATLNVGGPLGIDGTQASIRADARLVRVNVTEPQAAGDIEIRGNISGTLSVTAPTGVSFSSAPTVSVAGGNSASPRLESNNTVFSVNIGNPEGGEVTVSLTGIRYVTAMFGVSGGVEGALAVEVGGSALGGNSALAVNAFTAKTELEGEPDEDETEQPPPEGGSNGNNEEQAAEQVPVGGGTIGTPPTSSSQRRDSSRADGSSGPRQPGPAGQPGQRWQGGNFQGGGGGRQVPSRAGGGRPGGNRAGGGGGGGGQQAGGGGESGGGQSPQQSGGARQTPANVGGSQGHLTERMQPGDYEPGSSGEGARLRGERVRGPEDLPTAPGIYFTDRDFNPVSAVVLDRVIGSEAGGRIWVKLVLPNTRTPDRVDTVTVRVTIAGSTREITLTETGPNTGEFRCSRDGILIVSGEDPDSTTDPSQREEVAPRARMR